MTLSRHDILRVVDKFDSLGLEGAIDALRELGLTAPQVISIMAFVTTGEAVGSCASCGLDALVREMVDGRCRKCDA